MNLCKFYMFAEKRVERSAVGIATAKETRNDSKRNLLACDNSEELEFYIYIINSILLEGSRE